MDLAWVFTHLNVIFQILEKGRHQRGVSFHRAIFYCITIRKRLHEQAERNDADLDIGRDCQKIQKDIMDEVEQRLESVLLSVKITSPRKHCTQNSDKENEAPGTRRNVHEKQHLANMEDAKRVQAAKKDLENKKRQLDSREKALHHSNDSQNKEDANGIQKRRWADIPFTKGDKPYKKNWNKKWKAQ